METVDRYMEDHGFKVVHVWAPSITEVRGVNKRDYYFAKVYQYPESYLDKNMDEKEDLLMKTRLALRKIGETDEFLHQRDAGAGGRRH